jgi:pyruvyltransferase
MTVPVYWHYSENFGDALAPWIVERLTKDKAVYTEPKAPHVPYLITGSIFGWSVRRGVVWGTGCAYASHLDPTKLSPPSDVFRVEATRGNLSKALVEEAGHTPKAAADPGLILPSLYRPKPSPSKTLGVVCSIYDFEEVQVRYRRDCLVLNTFSPIEKFIDQLVSCDLIVSSCLHGLVAAIAYGKPVVWAQFTHEPVGDGFKFRDFFSIFDEECPNVVRHPQISDFERLARTYQVPDLSSFLDACPLPHA